MRALSGDWGLASDGPKGGWHSGKPPRRTWFAPLHRSCAGVRLASPKTWIGDKGPGPEGTWWEPWPVAEAVACRRATSGSRRGNGYPVQSRRPAGPPNFGGVSERRAADASM